MTDHDAAPAARASVESVAPQPTTVDERGRPDNPLLRPVDGTGDPVQLTDAEREAIKWAIFEYGATHPDHGMAAERAATLRGLLERTK